ncbi:hypothetical protein D9M68_548160 [compost metagenome]
MKVTVTTTYEVVYGVVAREDTEGGMDVYSFAENLKTLEEALFQLELAETKDNARNWRIELDVTRTTSHDQRQGK